MLCSSVVLEIKATSIDPTTTFSTGWTLRFPRTLGLRDKDHKAWEEAMPLSDLTKLRADMALVGDGNLSVKAPTASSGRVCLASLGRWLMGVGRESKDRFGVAASSRQRRFTFRGPYVLYASTALLPRVMD